MPKVLKEEDYRALKDKADAYDAVAAVVAEAGALEAEAVTPEAVREALGRMVAGSGDVAAERDALQARVDALQAENEQLRSLPGAGTVTSQKPKADAPGGTDDDTLLAFARKHAGDTRAIVAEMKEQGYKPSKL